MFKIIKRIVLALLAGAVLFVAHTWFFKPLFLSHFYSKVFLEYVVENPELISTLGLPINYFNGELTDVSLAYEERSATRLKENIAILNSYDTKSLTAEEKVSYDVLHWFIQNQVEGIPYQHHNYPVNQLFGMQNNLPSFMDSYHKIESEGDAEDYIARLYRFLIKFDQALEGLHAREDAGIIPPKFVIKKVLAEMEAFVAKKPEENILFVSFQMKLDKVEGLDDKTKTALKAKCVEAIQKSVYKAYGVLIDYFAVLEHKADDRDGVWKFPNGDEYYKYAIKSNTTLDLEPQYVHDLGLDEVERITKEIRAVFDSLGYSPDKSIADLFKELSAKEGMLYPDTDDGRVQCLKDFKILIDEMDKNLSGLFDVRPKMGVQVKHIPEFKQKTAPGAYYQGPALDGSRPGVFYANLRDMKEIPKFGMATLAYHEAIPGHHFQIAIQTELKGLPFFRSVIPFTAFAEGWALYAERLVWESGFHKDPYTNLGRLQAENFRAVRLVVDTGIHYKKWTREEAIKYMIEKTGMPEGDVVAEIERYIVNPGQACAYKIGQLKVLELRDKARKELGQSFDIKKFHNVLLTGGSVPLSVLEVMVDAYIKEAKKVKSEK